MKKLIVTTAFLFLGTLFMSAQTTKKTDAKRKMSEKPASSTEMKMDTSVQPNGMNRTVDTATINNTSKMQSNPDRLKQNQTVPSNGTMQNPNTTLPNNGTLQNPNTTTTPNNSTMPQQPLGPNTPTNPSPTR